MVVEDLPRIVPEDLYVELTVAGSLWLGRIDGIPIISISSTCHNAVKYVPFVPFQCFRHLRHVDQKNFMCQQHMLDVTLK